VTVIRSKHGRTLSRPSTRIGGTVDTALVGQTYAPGSDGSSTKR